MVHEQPQSPSGVLHNVALSPSTSAAVSGFKVKGSHISIDIPGDGSASRSDWCPAMAVGLLVFAIAMAQVALASWIRQKVSLRRQPSPLRQDIRDLSLALVEKKDSCRNLRPCDACPREAHKQENNNNRIVKLSVRSTSRSGPLAESTYRHYREKSIGVPEPP